MTAEEQQTSYTEWTGRKRATLRRRLLDCGCPNDGVVAFHLWCDRMACQQHAEDPHDCGQFGGAKTKSSSEEESVPGEAVVEAPARTGAAMTNRDFLALLAAADRAREEIDGPPPPTGAREIGITNPTDPISPLIQEAFRREVQRQGFTWYQVDGQTFDADQPVTRGRIEPDGPLHPGPGQFRWLNDTPVSWVQTPPDDGWMTFPMESGDLIDVTGLGETMRFVVTEVHGDGTAQVEPVAPPVDAAFQPVRPGDSNPGALIPGEGDVPQPVDAVVEPDPEVPGWPRDAQGRRRIIPRDAGAATIDFTRCRDVDDIATPQDRPWWLRWLPGGHR